MILFFIINRIDSCDKEGSVCVSTHPLTVRNDDWDRPLGFFWFLCLMAYQPSCLFNARAILFGLVNKSMGPHRR